MKRLTLNRAQCRSCRDVITSESLHDFRTCRCGKVSVDGGLAYLRRVYHGLEDVIEMAEYKALDNVC